jgi:hypothetical protein
MKLSGQYKQGFRKAEYPLLCPRSPLIR